MAITSNPVADLISVPFRSLQGFYNIVEPDNIGPEWSVRFTFQLLFLRWAR